MRTTRLDGFAAHGTPHGFTGIRLTDGHTIDVRTAEPTAPQPGPFPDLDVYLPEGINAPDTEAWSRGDWPELAEYCGDEPVTGDLYVDVPVEAVRALIEEHGGEAPPITADDKVIAMPLAQLRAAGVRCLEDGDQGGYYVRVPLADGTEITFAGTTTNRDHPYPDVSIHHPVREHRGWSAQWGDGGNVFADVYHSHADHSPYEEDTAALVVAVLARVRRSGGSSPEEGAGESAEQLALKALAEWGLTAHTDEEEEPGNTWLVIGRPGTGECPDMDNEPYVVLSLYNEDDDAWVLDRPPARPGDEWQVLTGDGTGAETPLTTRPADQLALCIAAIANWLTEPRT